MSNQPGTWAYLDIPEPAPMAHLFRPGEVSAVCGRTAPRAVLPTLDQDPEHPHNCPWCMFMFRAGAVPQK